ncbi:hypothetical protein Tco_0850416 [Tanacetum coccineum]
MVINSPCLNSKKELAIPEQTATGKESTNPLMADSLPRTIMPTKLVNLQGFSLWPKMGIQTPTKTKDQTLVSKQFDQGIQSQKQSKIFEPSKTDLDDAIFEGERSIAKLIKFSECIQRMNISCSLVADGISRERCHANVNGAELKKSVDELNLDR